VTQTLTFLRPYDALRYRYFFAIRRITKDNRRYFRKGQVYSVVVQGQTWGDATLLVRLPVIGTTVQKLLASMTDGLVGSLKGPVLFMVLEWEAAHGTIQASDTSRDDTGE